MSFHEFIVIVLIASGVLILLLARIAIDIGLRNWTWKFRAGRKPGESIGSPPTFSAKQGILILVVATAVLLGFLLWPSGN
jgi:hypothetical protein